MNRRWSLMRIVALVAILAGCGGGDGGDDDPIGPDGPRPVGSIVLVAGGNQNVGPASVVPTAPTIQVKSDRGEPLSGATVVLSVEGGRGTLDASSITTDANGTASFPRWVAPLTTGQFAVNATATAQAGGSATVRVTATVADAAVPSVTQTVGPGGGTVSIPATVPPLGGLQIIVPPGALPQTQTISIAYGPPPALPAHLTPASPLIGIAAGNAVADSLIELRIPATATAGNGQTLRAFVLAADNSLVPLPTTQSTTSSITVHLSDFREAPNAIFRMSGPATRSVAQSVAPGFGIRVLVALWTVPTTGTFDIGFVVGNNNMGFVNYGSVAAPGGYCSGSVVAAGAWFAHNRGAAALSARDQFPPLLSAAETGGWWMSDQLNPAIRLAAELQETYGSVDATIGSWKGRSLVQNDGAVWENVLYQLTHGEQPVWLGIINAARTTGHAILAYKADAATGTIWVADPNHPEDPNRTMHWNAAAGTWAPFMASANASTPNNTAYVIFADASYLFWEQRTHINSVIQSYNATRLVAEQPPATGLATRQNGTVVPIDNTTTAFTVQARDDVLRLTFTNIGTGQAHAINVSNGAQTNAPIAIDNVTRLTAPLKTGENRIGIVLEKASGGKFVWFDAKLLIVHREEGALKFLTQPSNAEENQSIGPVKVAVVDEDGNPVAGPHTLTLSLTGGAAGAVLSGGGTFNTLADGTADLSPTVNKAGEGYRLRLTGPPTMTAVDSDPFNITSAAAFTGRVVHAVSGTGLGGVTVVVTDGMDEFGATTAANGDWTVTGLQPGTWEVTASRSGFVSTTAFGQVLVAPSTVVEPIPLVPDGPPGGVFGQLRSATTSQLITTLTTVDARSGINNTSGPTIFSQPTSTGTYALPNLPAGVYTLTATNSAYAPTHRTGVVVGGGPATEGPALVMNPLAGGALARVVLTWGTTPRDLDSHVTGPNPNGSRFWVYFSNKGSCPAAPFVCLDVDNTAGFGPETMTFTQIQPGVYRYYVHDFTNQFQAGSTALGASGARVEFFVGGEVHTFFVPSGVGNVWAVFEWDGTTVTRLNQISEVPPPFFPARAAGPPTAADEIRRLGSLPAKPPR